ncbi:hypothetical protein GCM10011519_19980 [Marmoricola endophyticus]|uniref:DUF403 domain-containing protein n=1 Tax=Marmoricola endophyticus TaxID=2040280 RepID=A0A917F3V4_9ACTN|nr:circularly permuted type 2 ATP-grasp protein [Marmoricola endophyticus]GGF46093.1 hypothetical protein GCM10011519_19980 [Marmoricola endophyticus]
MTALRDYADRVNQPELSDPSGSPTRWDEMVGPDGGLRAPWKALASVAVGLTEHDLARVGRDVTRFLADDGVTYVRPHGRGEVPWRLDPVPLVLDAADWASLEVGLAQRAELLDAVLVDLYGEQTLLAEGVVPPEVVHTHPGFVRALARRSYVDPHPLLVTGTDLGRGPDGAWLALGDRTQAPSGIGFAMENRRVVSRVLPELYREARLHRLGPFFSAMRSVLMQSGGGETADARVVVLSTGAGSETAYDQAFVASTLGFPLVEGADLVVRDGYVHLRTAGSLERVDVILRRVDAEWTDPLELRGDSRLGVAGLTEVVRRGRVRVVNGLGSGVLESPALLPYLPAACRHLLDEDLRLASVPTWWGGSEEGRAALLDRSDLVVRTVDDPAPLRLPAEDLRDRVLADPGRYVGQEPADLSWSPQVGPSGAVHSRPVSLRTFALQHGGAYRPMVGGLASVLGDDRSVISSKDVWVLKASPEDPDQGLAEVLPLSTLRAPEVTVPRVLEDMFWLGRYVDRAEAALRLTLAATTLAEEARPATAGDQALAVVRGAVHRLAGPGPGSSPETDLRSVLLDGRRVGTAAHAVAGMREAAQSVRDQLSADVWRAFGVLDRAAELVTDSPYRHQLGEGAGRMLTGVLSVDGVVASMMRDQTWHVIEAGRCLERALQLAHLLRATTCVRRGLDVDRRVLDAVLVATESSVTHRRRFRGHVRPASVVDLLLLDRANPRSLRFALVALADHLSGLAGSTGSTRPERLVADLLTRVEETDTATLVAIGGVDRPHLADLLDEVLAQLSRTADAIAELHFSTGPAPRPFPHLVVAGP